MPAYLQSNHFMLVMDNKKFVTMFRVTFYENRVKSRKWLKTQKTGACTLGHIGKSAYCEAVVWFTTMQVQNKCDLKNFDVK